LTVDVKKQFTWLYNNEKGDYVLTEMGTAIARNKNHNTETVCSKCLQRFTGWNTHQDAKAHSKKCLITFNNRVYRQLKLLIVKVTPDSSRSEQQICENISRISMTEQNRGESVLRSSDWFTEDCRTEVFLLTEGETTVGYLAINKIRFNEEGKSPQQCIVVSDIFVIWSRRRCKYMTFLLLESLRSINESLDTVYFQDSLSLDGKKFLDKTAKALGVAYKSWE
jgi:hypothetical protein